MLYKLQIRQFYLQINELVNIFNRQVGNQGWVGMRGYHDCALIDEFQRRGIDVSAIYDGKAISFVHSIKYEFLSRKLVKLY